MTDGEKIKTQLKWLGMTQYEFAEQEGFPLPILRRAIKHGVGAITPELAERLCEALEIELDIPAKPQTDDSPNPSVSAPE